MKNVLHIVGFSLLFKNPQSQEAVKTNSLMSRPQLVHSKFKRCSGNTGYQKYIFVYFHF